MSKSLYNTRSRRREIKKKLKPSIERISLSLPPTKNKLSNIYPHIHIALNTINVCTLTHGRTGICVLAGTHTCARNIHRGRWREAIGESCAPSVKASSS